MGNLAKGKPKTNTSTENWGMGLLLVFFPEENTPTPTTIVDKPKLLSSSSSFSKSLFAILRRNNSNKLLTTAQSTISICALLVFITLLVFTLSTFEPTSIHFNTNNNANTKVRIPNSRRFLPQTTPKPKTQESSIFGFFNLSQNKFSNPRNGQRHHFALQKMGTLYRRGTKAMNDLIVAHVVESVNEDELRLFFRGLHRSSLMSRADLVLIFSSFASSLRFGAVIEEENELFLKLLQQNHKISERGLVSKSLSSFDTTQFLKSSKKDKEVGEPLWGKRIRSNYSGVASKDETESTQLSYGSVVSFESSELDPENTLAGFLGHVPMSLRRWACYSMLLGRVRRNFKHIMLVDVKNVALLGDPLGGVRNRSSESVYILNKSDGTSKHGKKNSDRTRTNSPVNSGIIMGGSRGVRRLSGAMLTEIVRVAMQQQHRKRNSVSESAVLSQLVSNEFILKNVDLLTSTELALDTSSVMQRGNSHNDLYSMIKKHICSSESDSSVYSDC